MYSQQPIDLEDDDEFNKLMGIPTITNSPRKKPADTIVVDEDSSSNSFTNSKKPLNTTTSLKRRLDSPPQKIQTKLPLISKSNTSQKTSLQHLISKTPKPPTRKIEEDEENLIDEGSFSSESTDASEGVTNKRQKVTTKQKQKIVKKKSTVLDDSGDETFVFEESVKKKVTPSSVVFDKEDSSSSEEEKDKSDSDNSDKESSKSDSQTDIESFDSNSDANNSDKETKTKKKISKKKASSAESGSNSNSEASVKKKKKKKKKEKNPALMTKSEKQRYETKEHNRMMEENRKKNLKKLDDAVASDEDDFQDYFDDSSKGKNVDNFIDDDIQSISSESSTASEVEEEIDEVKVPLSKRLVNVSKTDDEKAVYLPNKLAALLKDHQLEGIRFCWDHVLEPTDDNIKGCVLAHSMGLGKTLQMVSFCYLFHRLYKPAVEAEPSKPRRTLIITPKSVSTTWYNEFKKWFEKSGVSKDALKVHVFDREKLNSVDDRIRLFDRWEKHGGVLIISFPMFSRLVVGVKNKKGIEEKAKPKDPLQAKAITSLCDPGPDLVIVDEGHILKNEKTNVYIAAKLIKTRNKIVLTGTPLQNNLMEYFYMVDFIRPRYWEKKEFKEIFEKPIQNGCKKDSTEMEVRVMKRRSYVLVDEMKQFVHRKDQSVLRDSLPPKHEFVIYIKIQNIQRDFYRNFLKCNQQKAFSKNVLYFVAMLQKIINHPDLLPLYCKRMNIMLVNEEEQNGSSKQMKITDIFSKKSENSSTASSSNSTQPVIPKMVVRKIDDGKIKKPVQKKKKKSNAEDDDEEDIDELLDSIEQIPDDYSWLAPVLNGTYKTGILENSSKMVVLFELLNEILNVGEKVLIFSQYTETLDVIENLFKKKPIKKNGVSKILQKTSDYLRLDGSLDQSKRDEAVKSFNRVNGSASIFLISTRAGNLGLTLTAATRVILVDVSWSPTNDNQALFRAYRYGQTKEVFVYRLVAANTVEENIWKKCIQKNWLFRRIIDDKIPVRNIQTNDLDLKEFDQNQETVIHQKSSEILKRDAILQRLCGKLDTLVKEVLEHESLYIEDYGDKLTQEEQIASKEDYQRSKTLQKGDYSSIDSYASTTTDGGLFSNFTNFFGNNRNSDNGYFDSDGVFRFNFDASQPMNNTNNEEEEDDVQIVSAPYIPPQVAFSQPRVFSSSRLQPSASSSSSLTNSLPSSSSFSLFSNPNMFSLQSNPVNSQRSFVNQPTQAMPHPIVRPLSRDPFDTYNKQSQPPIILDTPPKLQPVVTNSKPLSSDEALANIFK